MAPLISVHRFDGAISNGLEVTRISDSSTAVAICVSFASFAGFILLTIFCGCCRKKRKKPKNLDLEPPPPNMNGEGASMVPTDSAAARSKAKSTKVGKTGDVCEGPKEDGLSAKEKSQCEPNKETPAETPIAKYLEMEPAAAPAPPPAQPVAERPHYYEISVHEKPKSVRRPPPALERAPAREPAYRTLYGIGDDFQASNRGGRNEDKPRLMGASPTPKLRYLSIAPDLKSEIDHSRSRDAPQSPTGSQYRTARNSSSSRYK